MTKTIDVVLCKECIYHRTPECAMSYAELMDQAGYPEFATIFLLNKDNDFCPYGEEKES